MTVVINLGCHDTIITVTWIFYLSSSKVEHIVLVIKMALRVITLPNALTTVSLIFPFPSSKVEHVGRVMIS